MLLISSEKGTDPFIQIFILMYLGKQKPNGYNELSFVHVVIS